MNHISSIAVRQRIIGAVEFVCPRCGLDRDGQLLIVRRWWRLIQMPIAPLGEPDQTVACGDCGHRCDIGVLEIPTTTQLALLLERASVAAVCLLVRATPDGASMVDRAVAMLRAEGYQYDAVRLLVVAEDGTRDVDRTDVGRLRHELTLHGKHGFVHRMIGLVSADAPLCASHRDALVDIGRALGLSVAGVRDLLAVDGEHADA